MKEGVERVCVCVCARVCTDAWLCDICIHWWSFWCVSDRRWYGGCYFNLFVQVYEFLLLLYCSLMTDMHFKDFVFIHSLMCLEQICLCMGRCNIKKLYYYYYKEKTVNYLIHTYILIHGLIWIEDPHTKNTLLYLQQNSAGKNNYLTTCVINRKHL